MAPLAHLEDAASTDRGYAPRADLLLRALWHNEHGSFKPTQCQADAALRELRLLTLAPVGRARTIPFSDIVAVEKPNGEQDKTINVRWVQDREANPMSEPTTLELWPS